MLASLTDRTLSTKKDLTEIEQGLKSKNEDLQKLIKDCQSEMQDLKIKVIDLTRKVNSNSNQRPEFSSSNSNIPGKYLDIILSHIFMFCISKLYFVGMFIYTSIIHTTF